jgi:four helix bundle protein
MANSFQNLIVWQKAHLFVLDVYAVTKQFPKEELLGLTSQIRRAGVSVSSNIVEGSQRGSDKDFLRFLRMARGSLAEVQAQLMLAKDLDYIQADDFEKLALKAIEINKLLNGLMKGVARD